MTRRLLAIAACTPGLQPRGSVPLEDRSLTVAAPIRATTAREWFPARAKYCAAIILLASSCKPWTVRPIGESVQSQSRGLDAPAYVSSIWDTKVIPYVREHALDVASACQAAQRPGPAQFLVKGDARVLHADAASRSGLLPIDVAPFDGHADAAIQMGPVIRGTALRDSLPFIEFSQFLNQLEFARVSNELNARALRTALPPTLAAGQMISFTGAMARPAPGQLPEIVPTEFNTQRRPE
jgi:predicted lipoprotein